MRAAAGTLGKGQRRLRHTLLGSGELGEKGPSYLTTLRVSGEEVMGRKVPNSGQQNFPWAAMKQGQNCGKSICGGRKWDVRLLEAILGWGSGVRVQWLRRAGGNGLPEDPPT